MPTLHPFGIELIQFWYSEVLDIVKRVTGVSIEEQPVRLTRRGDLNATVTRADGAAVLSLDARLAALLNAFNQGLGQLGCDAATLSDGHRSTSQELVDSAMELIYTVQTPPPPSSPFVSAAQHTNLDAYLAQHTNVGVSTAIAARLAQKQISYASAHQAIAPTRRIFSDSSTLARMLESQIKFIMLHELAHIVLGHTPESATEARELAADYYAAEVLFAHIGRYEDSNTVDLTPLGVLALFLTMKFVEDLVAVTDRGIEYAILAERRAAFRPQARSYPSAAVRGRALLAQFPELFLPSTRSIAVLIELGMHVLKRHFALGLVDLRYFKWYCRVRAQELMLAHEVRRTPNDERSDVASMLRVDREWSPMDVRRGPLVEELFQAEWFTVMYAGAQT